MKKRNEDWRKYTNPGNLLEAQCVPMWCCEIRVKRNCPHTLKTHKDQKCVWIPFPTLRVSFICGPTSLTTSANVGHLRLRQHHWPWKLRYFSPQLTFARADSVRKYNGTWQVSSCPQNHAVRRSFPQNLSKTLSLQEHLCLTMPNITHWLSTRPQFCWFLGGGEFKFTGKKGTKNRAVSQTPCSCPLPSVMKTLPSSEPHAICPRQRLCTICRVKFWHSDQIIMHWKMLDTFSGADTPCKNSVVSKVRIL